MNESPYISSLSSENISPALLQVNARRRRVEGGPWRADASTLQETACFGTLSACRIASPSVRIAELCGASNDKEIPLSHFIGRCTSWIAASNASGPSSWNFVTAASTIPSASFPTFEDIEAFLQDSPKRSLPSSFVIFEHCTDFPGGTLSPTCSPTVRRGSGTALGHSTAPAPISLASVLLSSSASRSDSIR